jgi:hypothetical protein
MGKQKNKSQANKRRIQQEAQQAKRTKAAEAKGYNAATRDRKRRGGEQWW